MASREETNLKQYIVSQRIIIEQKNLRIQNLIDDVEALHDHIKVLEQSLLMRKATLLKEMAAPG